MNKLLLIGGGLVAVVCLCVVVTIAAVGIISLTSNQGNMASVNLGSSSAVGKVGERRESAGAALTVHSVKRTATVGEFDRAKEGSTYLLVEVTVEASGKDKLPYSQIDFTVKDGDSNKYSSTVYAADDRLSKGDLKPGEKVRGIVAFQVPVSAKGLVVSYQPEFFLSGKDTQEIRIALE